ncbi:MAG: signal peptidase II [Bifidobacteriaceae bacterium]|nr:signal peptidase II [Bifidobacteriaceae bacterium]
MDEPAGVDGPIEPVARFGRQTLVLLGVAAVGLIIDQLTKAWAVGALSGGRSITLIDSLLTLRLVRNPGAAFSMGESMTWVFTILSAAVLVGVIWFSRRVRSRSWTLTLGLLAAGAAGNLGDRLFRPPAVGRGHVVDFIDYAGKFVGNVADIAIVLATIAIVITVLRGIPIDGVRK